MLLHEYCCWNLALNLYCSGPLFDHPGSSITMDNITVYTCGCTRTFSTSGALNKHLSACGQSKKRLSSLLSKAKQAWIPRKRQRISAVDTLEPGLAATVTPTAASLFNLISLQTAYFASFYLLGKFTIRGTWWGGCKWMNPQVYWTHRSSFL